MKRRTQRTKRTDKLVPDTTHIRSDFEVGGRSEWHALAPRRKAQPNFHARPLFPKRHAGWFDPGSPGGRGAGLAANPGLRDQSHGFFGDPRSIFRDRKSTRLNSSH